MPKPRPGRARNLGGDHPVVASSIRRSIPSASAAEPTRMSPTNLHHLSAPDRRRHDRTVWRTALLLSVLFHLLLVVAWRGRPVIPVSPFGAAGPRNGDNRAAAGSMRAMNISTPQPRPIVPPPVPIQVSIDVKPVEVTPLAQINPATVIGSAPGNGVGPGTANGTGKGNGGTGDSGYSRLQPPTPRGMIIPPSDKSLRGTKVQVWVFVNAQGRVVPDSTRLNPPTKSKDFNRRLIQEASQWVFRPATRAGKAVASWFPYTISM